MEYFIIMKQSKYPARNWSNSKFMFTKHLSLAPSLSLCCAGDVSFALITGDQDFYETHVSNGSFSQSLRPGPLWDISELFGKLLKVIRKK